MIEQTEMVITEWKYYTPSWPDEEERNVQNFTSLDVMRKRTPTKKGIAFRFSCQFVFEDEIILEFIGEDSYVIDFEEVIDRDELLRMIRNSYTKFTDKFDLRKLGTILMNRYLKPLDESLIDIDAILPLLI